MRNTARVFRTHEDEEMSLTFKEKFVYHHRLECRTCGVMVQPTELERTLWTDCLGSSAIISEGTFICPSCIEKREVYEFPFTRRWEFDRKQNDFFEEMQESRSDDFNKSLSPNITKLGNTIVDLQDQLKAAKSEYDSLIKEAKKLTDCYQWIDKKELDSGLNWKSIDFLF